MTAPLRAPPLVSAPQPGQVFEQLSSGVLVTDIDGVVVHANPALEALLSISAAQLVGQTLEQVAPLAERAPAARRALDSGRPLIERSVDVAGSVMDVHFNPVDEERSAGLVVELVPLDRHLELTEEFQREGQQQALSELLRGLAHEIKNPLGGLRGAAQLLERRLPDPELTEYTRVIVSEADRLAALVDRIQDPRPNRPRGPVNLHEVLEHVAALTLAAHEDSLVLVRDYDPSIPELPGDRDRLVQTVLNLVQNAVEAGAGNVVLATRILRRATVAGGVQRPAAAISIRDDGPGVDETLRSVLFYPLVTGRSDGTGLGLAIAQRIAHEHGGLIRYQSQPGDTTFTLILPLEPVEDPA